MTHTLIPVLVVVFIVAVMVGVVLRVRDWIQERRDVTGGGD